MRSMTGYGEATAEGKQAQIVVQVRTLNHRHLDIQLRVPREYLSLEEEIRKAIRDRVSRGRVEIFVTRSQLNRGGRRLDLDEELLEQYIACVKRLKRKFGLKGEVDLSFLTSVPELFRVSEVEAKEDESALVLGALESALRSVELSREREGRHLRLDIESQVRQLRRLSARIEREAKKLRESSVEIAQRLGSEAEAAPAPDWALKDIHEEAVRLKGHVEALKRLSGARGPIGKKLDFLLQEIQRELNTISSKAPQLSVVRLVLEGKDRVEKIREQAQNVE